jgi:nitroreductase
MTDFNDRTSTLSLLSTRRSGKPRDMVRPGPSSDQIEQIVRIASRVPDHGKLAPWRFIAITDEGREQLASVFEDAFRSEKPEAPEWEVQGARDFVFQAPTLVIVISSPRLGNAIPPWEQELSAGAACMNLLVAAHALGFVGGWLTGWAAYSDQIRATLGAVPGERIAGFIFIGSPGRALDERPRPKVEDILTYWPQG